MNQPKGFLLAATLTIAGSFLSSQSAVASELKPVVDKSAAINESAAASQKKIDRLAEQIQDKLQQFKAVNKEIDGLNIYNQQMERQIENQALEMQRLNESIDQVSVIERQITPLMLKMIGGLEDFVALDVPFLPEERNRRLQSLAEMMDRSDVAVSEKFRRVLEAYQIEVDYGRTIEAYTGMAKVAGNETEVNFLRIGRVALVYQTRDREKMGIWDAQERNWKELDDSFRTDITKGLRMARKQMAPDMLMVPVAAPQ